MFGITGSPIKTTAGLHDAHGDTISDQYNPQGKECQVNTFSGKLQPDCKFPKTSSFPRSNGVFVKWGSEHFRLFFCLAYLPIFRFFDECMGNDEHFMHDGKQAFIEAGMELYEQDRKTCPFCEQSIRDEAMAWVDRHTQFLDCIYFCFCHQKGNFVLFPLDCFIHGIEKMSLHSGTNSENSAKSSRQKNAKIIAEMQNTKKNSSRT